MLFKTIGRTPDHGLCQLLSSHLSREDCVKLVSSWVIFVTTGIQGYGEFQSLQYIESLNTNRITKNLL